MTLSAGYTVCIVLLYSCVRPAPTIALLASAPSFHTTKQFYGIIGERKSHVSNILRCQETWLFLFSVRGRSADKWPTYEASCLGLPCVGFSLKPSQKKNWTNRCWETVSGRWQVKEMRDNPIYTRYRFYYKRWEHSDRVGKTELLALHYTVLNKFAAFNETTLFIYS